MIWALFAAIHSLLRAMIVGTSRASEGGTVQLGFLQSCMGLLCLLPFSASMHWPTDKSFYIGAIGASMILAIGVLIQLNLARQKKGRVSSIYMPVEALAAFVMWLILYPSILHEYMGNPLTGLAVVLAFVICIAGILFVRPHDLSWHTFGIVLPVGLTYAMAAVITKLVMPHNMIVETIPTFMVLNCTTIAFVSGSALLLKKENTKNLLEKSVLISAMPVAILSALGYGTLVAAVAYVPNPGYVGILAMLLPVWLMIWHGARKRDDDSNPIAGLLIVIGCLLLIVASL